MSLPLKTLQKYWKYPTFRNAQQEIIEAILAKKEVVALLPTGAGKSICFQVPALILEGVCIVISPLIALMQDQVTSLQKRNIKATTIPSKSTKDEIVTIFDNLKFGGIKFLYLSPERLQSSFIQEKIKELTISLIVVDEAHCISEWGHDFRPAYRNINILHKITPTTNTLALTASATQKVLKDVVSNLKLNNPLIIRKSFFKENLAYLVYNIEDKLFKLRYILTKITAPTIVYVNTRNKTIQISNYLNKNGFKSSFYHGKLTPSEKERAFDSWITEKTSIIIATNAFGMGIDKENVKAVIHFDIPASIENYVQEAGRAGRNGQKSFAILLQNSNDIGYFKNKTLAALPTIEEVKEVHQYIYQYFQIAKGELIEEAFNFNFLEFCKKYQLTLNKTTTIFKILINHGILNITQNFNKKSTIIFKVNSNKVLNYTTHKPFIKTLLRNYGGLFEQETPINEFVLAKKSNLSSKQVIAILQQLQQEDIIVYKQATFNTTLHFLIPREDNKTINRNAKSIKLYIAQKKQKALDIITFVKNNTHCRSQQLLTYFNEKKTKKCGICDVCLKNKKNSLENTTPKIIAFLQHKTATSKEICLALNSNEQDILVHLRHLLSEEK